MRQTRVAVIDCGASHVAGGLFARTGERLKLEQFACERFVVEPGREEEWMGAITAALQALAQRMRFRGAVTLVLPGHLVLTKFIKTPRVDAAKRAKVIQFEAQQNIPYALNDVVWAHAVVGESDLDLDVMLCAAKLEAVDALCAAAESAGFIPRSLMPGAQALQVLAVPAGREQASLVVNLGARSTTLLLAESARMHARTLSLGGQQVTQQLVESQDCDFAAAEGLKTSGRNAAILTSAVDSFATRLSQEITRSALHFKRQSGAANPQRVLLTGGAAQLPELATVLATRVNVPVSTLDPLDGVEIAHAAADADVGACAAQLADLVGAARVQLTGVITPLNLLPPRLLTQESRRRRQPWLAVAAVLAAAALLPPLMFYREWNTALQKKTIALDAEIAPLRRRETQNRANLEKIEQLQKQVAELNAIAARRANWQQLLADLQQRFFQVEDVWLERMELAPARSGADATAPLRIAISGRMLDRTNPLARVSDDLNRKVNALLASVVDSPYVSAVEGERFDDRQPGILHFDFVLVAEPARPL